MKRLVQAEILDSLSPDDPIALKNREDIWLINRLMGNPRWVKKALENYLEAHPQMTGRMVELGAGDGKIGRLLLASSVVKAKFNLLGVDLWSSPVGWSGDWQVSDICRFEFAETDRILLANLILHQFEDKLLAELGEKIERSNLRCLIMSEPQRRKLHIWQARAGSVIFRWHPASLHDATVSIEAGFVEDEIVDCLNLDRSCWKVTFDETLLGSNRVICTR